MEPLRILARLVGPISLRSGSLRLDSLLMAAVAIRDGLPPASIEMRPIEIPVALEPGGRFHLASFATPRFDRHEVRYINRRFPIAEAQALAEPKFRRIDISAGAQKSYRLPSEVAWAERDELEWYCVGDRRGVGDLLGLISYLGHKRSVGRGKVQRWTVEPVEPWGDGFPVVRDGKPLRALPPDWPGLQDPMIAYAVMTPPYWEHHREEPCAVPEVPS